jgi:diaminohydroxyphosphoribosylaminopyrimidine deaminase/5-amino-6-(5-phosphoribosylamino)uracil reductase
MVNQFDIRFMKRCFQLAEKGMGNVAPNPLVGAVIVHDNKIIGEGYHKKYGASHAEPIAINSVENKSLLTDSTIYISLEPCNHFGNTPPCADLILKTKFKRVVIANTDPNPKVNGSGIQKLKEAGIEITTGILENEGKLLNRRFFKTQIEKRPYIILKWAQTINGFIDSLDKTPLQISNDQNRQLVHSWRAQEDGILIGAQTFINDSPSLNTRNITGKSPTPILLLTKKLKLDYTLWKAKKQFIIIAPEQPSNMPRNAKWIPLRHSLNDSISELLNYNISSILVEGGGKTHQSFITENLWDETRITKGEFAIESGIKAAKWGLKTPSFGVDQKDNIVRYFFNEGENQ